MIGPQSLTRIYVTLGPGQSVWGLFVTFNLIFDTAYLFTKFEDSSISYSRQGNTKVNIGVIWSERCLSTSSAMDCVWLSVHTKYVYLVPFWTFEI